MAITPTLKRRPAPRQSVTGKQEMKGREGGRRVNVLSKTKTRAYPLSLFVN